ncbi:nucleoside hydrolase [Halocatena salina]|uniref:Nucleoside hydrolase n=1 Tax=Halocatena salina TaxID=2934340 RepID=A0A8U0AA43_9EURY|nr:nucleoside hydrolase [Halocatena salina]UPM44687.1 nucleoside hydrolase [Halocatena salina]
MGRKVLLDVDTGNDDAILLAMMLAAEDVDVVGVTTVSGNSTLNNTTQNTLSVLELFDRTDVPVAKGAERPLVREPCGAEWVHGENGIRGDLPASTTSPVDQTAMEFICDQVNSHGKHLTIAAVGPLTNIALAIANRPTLPDEIDELYLMGGSAHTHGNTTPVAEFNFWEDPEAASRVMQDGFPRMVGLDVTNQATVLPEFVDKIEDASPPLTTVSQWFDYPDELMKMEYGAKVPAIHDGVVGADIIGNILDYESYYLEVDTTDGPSRGAVICDVLGIMDTEMNVISEDRNRLSPTGNVAENIDIDRFREIISETILYYN